MIVCYKLAIYWKFRDLNQDSKKLSLSLCANTELHYHQHTEVYNNHLCLSVLFGAATRVM